MTSLRTACASVAAALAAGSIPVFGASAQAPAHRSTEIHVVRDIAYGSDPRQRLDIYMPAGLRAGTSRHKTLIFFHGGGWSRGTKNRHKFVGRAFARDGYVTVLANYRLYPKVRFPAFVDDAANAVGWVHQNIAQHGGDPDRLYLMGHSAGAHIAALVALDQSYLKAAGVPRSAVLGMIGLAGPYAFRPRRLRRFADVFTAHPNPNARPVDFAGNGGPPLLLLSAALDTIVGARQAPALARAHRRGGGTATAISYSGIGHVQLVLALAPAFSGFAPVRRDIVGFMGGP